MLVLDEKCRKLQVMSVPNFTLIHPIVAETKPLSSNKYFQQKILPTLFTKHFCHFACDNSSFKSTCLLFLWSQGHCAFLYHFNYHRWWCDIIILHWRTSTEDKNKHITHYIQILIWEILVIWDFTTYFHKKTENIQYMFPDRLKTRCAHLMKQSSFCANNQQQTKPADKLRHDDTT